MEDDLSACFYGFNSTYPAHKHTHKYHSSSEQFVSLHIVIIYLSAYCQLVHRQKYLIAHNRLFSEVLFSSISSFTVQIESCAPVLCVFLFFLFKWKITPKRKSYQNIFYRRTLWAIGSFSSIPSEMVECGI